MFKRTPLSGGFFLFGLLGLIIFGMRLYAGTIDKTWGFLMTFFSLILFISALISITPSLPKARDLAFDREIKKLREQPLDFDLPKKTIKKAKKRTVKKKAKKTVKKKVVKKAKKKTKKR